MPVRKQLLNYPFIVKGDIDGFIGLFIDNLVNLLIITGLCCQLGMPGELVFGKILPATALSVFCGNIFYSYQARRLGRREGRTDVTALPYGINTVTLIAFFSMIIAPVYIQTKDADLAWKVGVMSAFISGIFEGLGAFVGEWIRRITPRAALLSTLAGIAVAFIALEHTIKIWDKPVIAFIPLALIMAEYFSHVKLPLRIPAGFYALAVGSIIAWSTGAMDTAALTQSVSSVSLHVPGPELFGVFSTLGMAKIVPYLSISIPMGLMSFFGTLQNLESASAAGDSFPAKPALLMNGIGTIAGSLFGSPFPTTVYIGHPGWKGLGARAGYSVINGIVITVICFTGLMSVIVAAVPLEAGYPILLWIGVIITAQAFQATPAEHAPAVALGLMPAIASWALSILRQFINVKGGLGTSEINAVICSSLPHLKGLIPFSEGALFSAMFLTAVAVYLIEKNFLKAFLWTLPLILFSFFGFIHSSEIGIAMSGFIPLGYGFFAVTMMALHLFKKYGGGKNDTTDI
ncbi:MAG TPA: NCS2 family permease [Spirochaetota bacterium]|nr:NCS2 family permease [Spirochaetota bacterium]HPI89761.1 NCS2 family permease [Spirochaetota bacterium]HPR47590.1 NCS2 family permease [Spirochaetota bacterium]